MLNAPAPPVVRPLSSPYMYLVRMAVFLILCGFLALILFRQLQAAFFGNPGLNALILATLAVGVLLAVRQVGRLFREVRWINYVSGATPRRLARPPVLLAPVAALVGDEDSRARLSVATTRSLLDSISARIIGSLKSGGEASVLFDDLKNSLAAPLAGMGVSFSASLFGLASSLVLGFLDLQAGQAQTRFYNELEDWLAVAANDAAFDPAGHGAGLPAGAAPAGAAPVNASPDIAAALDRMSAAVGDGSGTRDAALAMAHLAEGVQALVQHVRSEQQLMRGYMESQATRDRELRGMLERLGREKVE